jgi:hypothetical protein
MFIVPKKKCNHIRAKRLALSLMFSLSAQTVLAATPLISIDLDTGYENHLILPRNGSALVQYTITNNDDVALLFELLPVPGISVIPRSLRKCSRQESLESHGSCTLTLLVSAEQLSGSSSNDGPSISVNSFWNYQASQPISVTVTDADAGATLTGQGLALSVNNPSLNAALTGTPREIKITNSGPETATNVNYILSPALPDDASISPSTCGTIAAGGTCTLTVTPGATAVSSTLTTVSRTASQLSIPLNILSYGSEYQSGYVFAIDDTVTPSTASVGGKVAALENQAAPWPLGLIWAANANTSCTREPGNINAFAPCTDYTFLTGIDELSTNPPDACNGKSDGICNTDVIFNYLEGNGISQSRYAAGLCKNVDIGGYNDWYLPSICEMGYYVDAPGTPGLDSFCGTEANPTQQNMLSNLFDRQVGNLLGIMWSSTEYSKADGTYNNAWAQYYFGNIGSYFSYQTHDGKENTSGVRCVRELT